MLQSRTNEFQILQSLHRGLSHGWTKRPVNRKMIAKCHLAKHRR